MKVGRWFLSAALVGAVAIPAVAAADGEAKTEKKETEFWGQLGKKVPRWAQQRAMRKGYLASQIKKAEEKHPAFAKLLHDAAVAHNASLGKAQGCWPNIRLALVTLSEAAGRGAGKPLAGPFGAAMKAFNEAHVNAKSGGMDAVHAALKAAMPELRRGVRPGFRVAVRQAMGWLKRPCNLWAPKAKAASEKQAEPGAKPVEAPKTDKATDVTTPSTNR